MTHPEQTTATNLVSQSTGHSHETDVVEAQKMLRFKVVVYAIDDDNASLNLGSTIVDASSAEQAQREALNQLWDHRLDSMGCVAKFCVDAIPRYIHGYWSHIFGEGTRDERECWIVYDRLENRLSKLLILDSVKGWVASSEAERADVEDSLKTANDDALENPENWDLEESQDLPDIDSASDEVEVDLDAVAEWVGLHYRRNFEGESEDKRKEWIERYVESHPDMFPDGASAKPVKVPVLEETREQILVGLLAEAAVAGGISEQAFSGPGGWLERAQSALAGQPVETGLLSTLQALRVENEALRDALSILYQALGDASGVVDAG